MTTELTTQGSHELSSDHGLLFAGGPFEKIWQIAKTLSASTMVPDAYHSNDPKTDHRGPANCLIALELASRLNASPFMVMQNLHVIKGKPSFGAKFVIAAINACGRFTPLRYQWTEVEGTRTGCRAHCRDRVSGDVLEGPEVTWDIVKKEGWLTRNGSKWQTMPEVMFQYRAATWWCNTHAPELLMGMPTADEVIDTDGEAGQATAASAALAPMATAPMVKPPVADAGPAPVVESLPDEDLLDQIAEDRGWSLSTVASLRGRVDKAVAAGLSFEDAVAAVVDEYEAAQ